MRKRIHECTPTCTPAQPLIFQQQQGQPYWRALAPNRDTLIFYAMIDPQRLNAVLSHLIYFMEYTDMAVPKHRGRCIKVKSTQTTFCCPPLEPNKRTLWQEHPRVWLNKENNVCPYCNTLFVSSEQTTQS